jgi:hypothetical protein
MRPPITAAETITVKKTILKRLLRLMLIHNADSAQKFKRNGLVAVISTLPDEDAGAYNPRARLRSLRCAACVKKVEKVRAFETELIGRDHQTEAVHPY